LQRDANPGAEPSASVRDDDRVQVRQVFKKLEANRSIAGDDRRVAHRVNEKSFHSLESMLDDHLPPALEGNLDDPGAKPRDGSQFGFWRVFRHDDRAPNPEPAGVPGHPLRHVPGASGPYALFQLRIVRHRQRVSRAPQLERANRLEILQLEVDLRWRFGVEPYQRAPQNRPVYSLASTLDLFERACAG